MEHTSILDVVVYVSTKSKFLSQKKSNSLEAFSFFFLKNLALIKTVETSKTNRTKEKSRCAVSERGFFLFGGVEFENGIHARTRPTRWHYHSTIPYDVRRMCWDGT